MANFEKSVEIGCPAETAFDFIVRPANLILISPPDVTLKFIAAPERFEHGCQFEFHLGGFGPVQQIHHEITEIDPPNRFTESLVKGPLKHWIHEHIVESRGEGKVVVIDRIEFEPPGGMIGFIMTEERIRESLEVGFEHRHREMKRLLEQTNG